MKNHGMSEPVIDDPDPTALPTRHRAAVCVAAWLGLCLAGWTIVGALVYLVYKAAQLIATYAH